jgi:hypothetical protein
MSRRGGAPEPAGAGGGNLRVLSGWAACALGLFCALWGLFNISVAYEVLGIVLGARRLAATTLVVSVVLLVVVLAAAQGYVPGVDASDPRAR